MNSWLFEINVRRPRSSSWFRGYIVVINQSSSSTWKLEKRLSGRQQPLEMMSSTPEWRTKLERNAKRIRNHQYASCFGGSVRVQASTTARYVKQLQRQSWFEHLLEHLSWEANQHPQRATCKQREDTTRFLLVQALDNTFRRPQDSNCDHDVGVHDFDMVLRITIINLSCPCRKVKKVAFYHIVLGTPNSV